MARLKPKVLIYLIINCLIFGFVSGEIQPISNCPEVDSGEIVLLPHPNCSYFYKCFNGAAYEQICPPDLQWNIEINACDWTNSANCVDGEAPEQPGPVDPPITQPPNERPPIHESCPEVNPDYTVHLPHPVCSLFYKCLDGVPYIYECPPELQWSIQFDRCEWSNIANCVDGKSPEQPGAVPPAETPPGGEPSENPVRPPIHDSCPKEDPSDYTVHLPHPNCAYFYKCLGGFAYELTCQPGLQWSIEFDRCEWPNTASCTDGAAPEQPGPPPTVPTEPPTITERLPTYDSCPERDPTDGNALLPHPDCSLYYQCINGAPTVFACPSALHWNEMLNQCDWPEDANCVEGQAPEQYIP